MTDPKATTRQALEDLEYLVQSWPALVTLRMPGSPPRAPSAHQVSEAQRVHAALLAITEREEARQAGAIHGTGPITAPVALAVVDLLARFVSVASDVAETVTQVAGVDRPAPPSSSWVDPRPYLLLARTWLSVAQQADDSTTSWVARQLHPLADSVALQLGEVHDGQSLAAICPWCMGRTEHYPLGGQRTLVVYARQSRAEQAGEAEPDEEKKKREKSRGPMIVCQGTNCTPPDSVCGTHVGGRPAWPEREWEWLAKRLLPERQWAS